MNQIIITFKIPFTCISTSKHFYLLYWLWNSSKFWKLVSWPLLYLLPVNSKGSIDGSMSQQHVFEIQFNFKRTVLLSFDSGIYLQVFFLYFLYLIKTLKQWIQWTFIDQNYLLILTWSKTYIRLYFLYADPIYIWLSYDNLQSSLTRIYIYLYATKEPRKPNQENNFCIIKSEAERSPEK